MHPLKVATLAGAILVASATAVLARQEHGNTGGHGAATAVAPASEGNPSPYVDRFDDAAAIRSLTPEQIGQIERGDGAGYALPAELNGVPGPRHVLDLAAELDLTATQEAAVHEIFDEMRAAAIPTGDRYLDAVLALEEGFRDGTLAADDVASLVAEAKRREGEVAAAHLVAHLETAALLTPEQVAEYGRLRGYE